MRMMTTIMMMTMMIMSTSVSMMMMMMLERDIQCGFNLALSRGVWDWGENFSGII